MSLISSGVSRVIIDPTVVLNILDHHARRGSKQTRVIGALYGIVRNDAVEVRQTIPILHEEDATSDTVTLGTQLWETMARNARKVQLSPIVGWYATDTCPATDLIIDQAFASKIGPSNSSLRFIMDASLKHGSLRMRMLGATEIQIIGKSVRIYRPVEFEVCPCNAIQATILDGLIATVDSNHTPAQREAKALTTKASCSTSTVLHRLREEIDTLLAHFELYNTNSNANMPLTCEQLYDIQKALSKVPKFSLDLATKLRESAVQDGATIQYLSKVINVQVVLIDRLLALVQGA